MIEIPEKAIYRKERLSGFAKELTGGLMSGKERARGVFGLPYGGRSTLVKQIFQRKDLLDEEAKELVGRAVWLIVDLPLERSLVEVLADQAEAIGWKGEKPVTFAGKVIERGLKLGVVINSLDSASNAARKRIMAEIFELYYSFPEEVKLIFGQGREGVGEVKVLLRDLYPEFLEHRSFVGMMEREDVVEFCGEDGGIFELSGGYLPMVKRLQALGEGVTVGAVGEDREILFAMEEVWDSLDEKSQMSLSGLGRGRQGEFGEYILGTGIVKKQDEKYLFFSPIFEKWVKKISSQQSIVFEKKEGVLHVAGRDLLVELSPQEYNVLNLLWEGRGEIVSREEVADRLWGKEAEEKYSDWAIDQTVSRLRRKIGDTGEERVIAAVRGKGFKLRVD